MSNTISYPHGTFSWADLRTTDGPAATAFYTGLFGWEAIDFPIPGGGVYTMLQQEGQDVCALSEMSPEEQSPVVWNSYITVDDVEATAGNAGELGGQLITPPFDVMDNGRMAVIQDPTGAFVALWQAYQHKGAGIFNIPNTMSWNELATRDPEGAKAFYTSLLGWETQTDPTGYTAWMNNGRANGGMMQITEEWGDVPPHWAVYFSVADCAATANQAQQLGANVLRSPFPAGDVGFISVIQDPQGAVFSVIQMNQVDATMP
ncbi:MAG: VOC family protein [Ardenticatenaceae bacterium]